MDVLAGSGTKVCLIGSWADEMVSLHSSAAELCYSSVVRDSTNDAFARQKTQKEDPSSSAAGASSSRTDPLAKAHVLRGLFFDTDTKTSTAVQFLPAFCRLILLYKNYGYHSDLLSHLGPFLPESFGSALGKSLFNKMSGKDGYHSSIHSNPIVYRLGIEWIVSGENKRPVVESKAATKTSLLNEGTKTSDLLNGIDIYRRTLEMIRTGSAAENPAVRSAFVQEAERVLSLLENSPPDNSHVDLLRAIVLKGFVDSKFLKSRL